MPGAAAAFIVRQIEQAAEKIECLIGIEISVEIGFLRQITDARLGGDVPGRMAEHFDMPFGRIQKTEQQLDRRGFARAVRSQQTEDFAAPDFEIDIVHGLRFGPAPEILEDFRQPAHDHDVLCRWRAASGRWRDLFFQGDHLFLCAFMPVAGPVAAPVRI